MNLINILPYHDATVTINKTTSVIKLAVKDHPALELNPTEAMALRMWLNNIRRHSLPSLLVVADKTYTFANTIGMSTKEYDVAVDNLLKFGMERGPFEVEAFVESDITLLGNVETPVYLRKREGAVDAVLGMALFVPKTSTKEEKAVLDEMAKSVFGSFGLPGLPVIVREIVTVTGEPRAVSLMCGLREMTITDLALSASYTVFRHVEDHFDTKTPRVTEKAQA